MRQQKLGATKDTPEKMNKNITIELNTSAIISTHTRARTPKNNYLKT